MGPGDGRGDTIMASTVNKRSFLWAMICPAQGWYHHRDRSTPSLGAQLLLEEGNKVGRRAHALFPGGHGDAGPRWC